MFLKICLLSLFLDLCIFLSVNSSMHLKLLFERDDFTVQPTTPSITPKKTESSFQWTGGRLYLDVLMAIHTYLHVADFSASSFQPSLSSCSLLPVYKPHYLLHQTLPLCRPRHSEDSATSMSLGHWYLNSVFWWQNFLRPPMLPYKWLWKTFRWFSHFQSLSMAIYLKYHYNTKFPKAHVTEHGVALN